MTRRTSKVSNLSDRRAPQRDPEEVIRWWADQSQAAMRSPRNPVAWVARWTRSARKIERRGS